MTKQKGFTLLELLVVIAIIGLLASIALVSLDNARIKARDAVRKTDFHNIRLALEMYYDTHGQYPYSNVVVPNEWIMHFGCGGGNSYVSHSSLTNFLQDLVDNKLFNKVPRDPINNFFGGTFYMYTNWSTPDDTLPTCTNDPHQFTLITILEKKYNAVDPDCAIPAAGVCIYAVSGHQ